MEEEISLEELFSIFRKKIKLIITWGLLGLSILAFYTFYWVTPMYESSSRIVVNQTQNINQAITNTDIQTNLNLINTYQSIIREPIILQNAIEKLDIELTIEELIKQINIETQDNSLVFGISVRDENPYNAAKIANAIATTFEEKIGDILEVQSVTILSEAIPNVVAISPDITKNLLIGLGAGLAIGIASALLFEYMDKRVKDIKIIEDLGFVNLGFIFEMTSSEVKDTRINKQNKMSPSFSRLSKRRV